MINNNETITYILSLLFIFLLMFIFITVYRNKTDFLIKFFTVLGGLSAVAVSINLIINTYVQMRYIYQSNQKDTLENQNIWVNIVKECVNHFPYSYRIYTQLFTDNEEDEGNVGNELLNDPLFIKKRSEVEFYICTLCIDAMEKFLVYGKYNQTGTYEWISTYIWLFYSPILVEYWEEYKIGYDLNTVEFIDSLVKVSYEMRENEPTTHEELIKYANKVKFNFEI